ncbi:MAG: ankyrin repeat domain-containing protein [Candidatus Margulisbacteria bacterium]|nr:ankyrin repeat domain-containing protein [Candidatus Margulisiibacteriota bacterium]
MNKIIAILNQDFLTSFLEIKIRLLKENRNIFSMSDADRLLDGLVALRKSGVNLRILISKCNGLEFLKSDSKPQIDKTCEESLRRSGAMVSVWTCLEKLDDTNKDSVLKKLTRDFPLLGFQNNKYSTKSPGYLGRKLIKAVKKDNSAEVENLLKQGADPNAVDTDKNGTSVLIYADKLEILSLLLESEVNINKKNLRGQTALMWFVIAGKSEMVRELLQAGVDVDSKDDWGKTALMYALYDFASNSKINRREIIKDLLQAGADYRIPTLLMTLVRFEYLIFWYMLTKSK